MLKREDLPALDLRVLETLTEATTTSSTVRLASDMWRSDTFSLGADPVGLIQTTLDTLSELGLVRFKLQSVPQTSYWEADRYVRRNAYSGLAYDIRLTKLGWTLMGYPNRAYQVGTRLATNMRLDPHGDRTNFRKHNWYAEGGPIEVDTFAEHRAKYPHHVHPMMWRTDEGDDMTRTYTKVTDALEGTVLGYRSRFPTDSYAEIAEATGIPERTVKYILVELPRLRRMADGDDGVKTQKERILDTLEHLDFKNVPTLIRTLGRGDTPHDIVHALHDLKKQGLVDFDERGTGQKEPQNIKMSARGRKASGVKLDVKDPNPLVGETQEEAVARRSEERADKPYEGPAVSPLRAPEEREKVEITERLTAYAEPIEISVPAGYPELDALLEREKKRLDADNRAINYLQAADIVRDTDPDTARLLEQKAAESDIPHPSPLESEYLRYVRDHA